MPKASDRADLFEEMVTGLEVVKANALAYERELGTSNKPVSNALFSLAGHCQYYINKAKDSGLWATNTNEGPIKI